MNSWAARFLQQGRGRRCRSLSPGIPGVLAATLMVFDYIFYRTARFFYRRDGRAASRALISVSSVQGLWSSALLLLLQRQFYTRKELAPYSKLEASLFCAGLVGLVLRNYFVYPDRYYALRARWKDESPVRRTLGGVGVVALIVSAWLAMIFLGVMA